MASPLQGMFHNITEIHYIWVVYSNSWCIAIMDQTKEDKNSIQQCIGQSHITMAFSNMAPFPSRTRVRQTFADVQLKQSNFMTSTENVNKLCLFVQETEHLQVKLTMMVCPERISNVYNFTDVGFILIQH